MGYFCLSLILFWPHFDAPLVNDEIYYANTIFEEGIGAWKYHSFGHPPGWLILNALNYKLRQVGPFFSRTFVFTLVWLSLLLLHRLLREFYKDDIRPILVLSTLFSYAYTATALVTNHPVLVASLLGCSGLILISSVNGELVSLKNKVAAFVLLAGAICIRESAIVFLIGALPLLWRRKNKYFILFQLLLFFSYYGVYYQLNDDILLNDQMRIVRDEGKSILIFSFLKVGTFLRDVFLGQFSWPTLVLILLALIPFAKKSFFNLFKFKTIAFLISGLLHVSFFMFYRDNGMRNSMMSVLPLIIWWGGVLQYERKPIYKLGIGLLIGINLYAFFSNIERVVDKRLVAAKEMKTELGRVENFLKENALNEKLILTTNPYHHYLENPGYGYVQNGLRTQWYGGVDTMKLDSKASIVLIPMNLENFATEKLREFSQINDMRRVDFGPKDKGFSLYFKDSLQ